jgi:hypothetical protein
MTRLYSEIRINLTSKPGKKESFLPVFVKYTYVEKVYLCR